jgi:hypothetical protein
VPSVKGGQTPSLHLPPLPFVSFFHFQCSIEKVVSSSPITSHKNPTVFHLQGRLADDR